MYKKCQMVWYVVFGSLSVYVQSVIIDTNIRRQSTVSEKVALFFCSKSNMHYSNFIAQICILKFALLEFAWVAQKKGARPKVIVSYFQLAIGFSKWVPILIT